MRLPSTVVGIVIAGMLLAVLGLARLLVPEVKEAELELREVEISALPEPPPPPPEEPPPDAPPPPPALTEVTHIPDPTRVPVPKAELPMDLTMPVDPFFTEVEVAPLPQPKPQPVRRRPVAKPQPSSRPSTTTKPRPPAPVAKSHYNISELDGKPRLIRHGSAVFPSSLARKGVTSGTVVFEVELSTSGSVSIRRVISSTHADLVSAARRVASSAKFTSPTRNGQRVKAIMRWPVTIRK
ncbi:energy transducer TonB [Haloferula chungangensis]|uniref:Energy transducer TonB n=1 Tax=Haloferula chungangensis TaxID=1048331 RepID=A0ABW2L9Q8_9BACT